MRYAFCLMVLVVSPALAADVTEPFNGKTLDGWESKKHGPNNKPRWVVGAATLDPADPRMFKVDPKGSELINDVTAHGQGVDAFTTQKFGDAVIELEVMVPKGSNSGIYVMGEYEIQVLDSFGNEKNPGQGDMGAIYGAAPPTKPVYKKPGEWSKYEIHFQAPKFDGDKKVANAKFLKVLLNGATIHENIEMKGPTPGGVDGKEKAAGPISFQGDHGPVSYRNIKVRALGGVAGVESGDAIALFDGSGLSHWQHEKGGEATWTVNGGVLTIAPGSGSIVTRESFDDFNLHVEFMIHPEERKAGQANSQNYGNSGVYIQRRYEVQVLDSHGREPEENGCGSIYKQRKPAKNASKPAGEWQGYDITFHAARWESEKKVKNARITVVHNGETIHDDVEVTFKTGSGQPEAPTPGPILLQDHGDVVSFRNITITRLD